MTSATKSIRQIIENEDDLGEVAEWVQRSAAQNNDDDDFDQVQKPNVTKEEQLHIDDARKRINQKLAVGGSSLSRRTGPLVNNLKDKAKMMAMQNTSLSQQPKVNYESSDEEELPEQGQESPDGKVFRLSSRSLGSAQKLEFEQANKERMIEQPKTEIKQITFVEAFDNLKTGKDVRNSIQFKEKKTQFFQKWFGCFIVHLKSSRLIQEKDQVCLLSLLQFDDNNQTHFRMLHTVYCQFVDTEYCLRYGNHWETIGFQGRDPATDFRGAGILGLLQMLAFQQHYKIYIKSCLETAQQQQYPLSITLINITTFVLIALKENKLNSLINKEDSVMSIVNKVYFSAFHWFFKQHKQNGNFHTIGNTLSLVRKQIYENPEKLIANFQKEINRFYKANV